MLKPLILRIQLILVERRIARLVARLRACYQEERLAYVTKVEAGVPEREAAEESVDMSVHLRELLEEARHDRWSLRFALRVATY